MTNHAHALRSALLWHASQADARPGLVLTDEALAVLNLAVSYLCEIDRTTPAERRKATHRMCKPANRLRNLAALLNR
jgi:hypothetical protein